MQNIPYIDYLNALPLDCLILEMLPVHAIYKHSMNGTSSRASSQETETDKIPVEPEINRGLKQVGATGTNLLAEENYLRPNLNNEEQEESWINNILHTHVEGTKENLIPYPA